MAHDEALIIPVGDRMTIVVAIDPPGPGHEGGVLSWALMGAAGGVVGELSIDAQDLYSHGGELGTLELSSAYTTALVPGRYTAMLRLWDLTGEGEGETLSPVTLATIPVVVANAWPAAPGVAVPGGGHGVSGARIVVRGDPSGIGMRVQLDAPASFDRMPAHLNDPDPHPQYLMDQGDIGLIVERLEEIEENYSTTANTNKAFGMLVSPTITPDVATNGLFLDGLGVAFLSVDAVLTETSAGEALPVPPLALELTTSGQVYYVVAKRSALGVLAYELETAESVLCAPNCALVAVAIRTGAVFHVFEMGANAGALANRLEQVLIETDGFVAVSGLSVSADSARVVTVQGGRAAFGATIRDLADTVSSVDGLAFYIWDGSAFIFSSVGVANNTHYNGPAGLTALSNANRYTINWLWRGVESQNHTYMVLSREEYSSLAAARAAQLPPVPPIIPDHAVFVGGLVYRRDEALPAAIILRLGAGAGGGFATAHNDLPKLQGGVPGERYHLSAAQYNLLQQPTDALGTLTTGDTITLDIAGHGATTATIPDAATITLAATGWHAVGFSEAHTLILTMLGAATVQIPVAWVPQGGDLTFDTAGSTTIVVYSPDGGTSIYYIGGQ